MHTLGRSQNRLTKTLFALGIQAAFLPLASQLSAQSWSWQGISSPSCYRYQHAMAFDCSRGRMVIFGGTSNCWCGTMGDTQEWNGSNWSTLSISGSAPSARREHAMAYDTSRSRIVMFGGYDSNSTLCNDVWELSGTTWSQITPTGTQPTARRQHAMCFDPIRGTTILFGGIDISGLAQADQWTWDGLAWTQANLGANAPSARSLHAMTFDAQAGRVVLFGGSTNSSGHSNEFWRWDGTTWSLATQTGNWPSARSGHGMTYDPTRRVLIMHGGNGNQGYLQDTWVHDGAIWSQVTSTYNSFQCPLVFDPSRGRALMHVGYSPNHGCINTTQDVGASGSNPSVGYTQLSTGGTPRYPYLQATAALPQGGLVMFGGQSYSAPLPVLTYEWQQGSWSKVYSLLNPSTRSEHALLLDPVRSNNLMFGGINPNGIPLNDTWTYANGQWQNIPQPQGPSARYGHRMCFDSARNEALLFGGLSAGGSYLDELWAWDGTAWSQKSVGVRPAGRYRHGFAFDSRRSVAVLYGGYDSNGARLDTWEWDGAAWSIKSPTTTLGACIASSAQARFGFGMAYEPRAERVVLFGGNAPSINSYSNDLWSWDGQNWQQHSNTTGVPGGRGDTQMVYDPTSRKLMIHAGGTSSFAYEDLWEVQLPVFSRYREYGTACIGSRGPLELRVVAGSLPILGQPFTTRLTGLSSGFAAGVGFVGFSDQSINGIPLPIDLTPVGIPGCSAYHSAEIDMPIGLPTGNPLSTTWNLNIPNDPVFLSVEIYLQALALEGFGFSRFATLSNGIAARIGDR